MEDKSPGAAGQASHVPLPSAAASPAHSDSDASTSSAHAAGPLCAPTSRDRLKQALEAVGASPTALLAPLRALVNAGGGGLTLQEAVAALHALAGEDAAPTESTPNLAAAAPAAADSTAATATSGEAKAPAAAASAAAAGAGPKPTPAQLFGRAARSAHLSYAELLNAFAASASGLDSESLADYLFNLQVLCGEAPDDELVLRPVISLPPIDSLPAHLQHAAAVAPPQRPLTSQAVWQQIVGGQQQLTATSQRAQFQHQSLLARGGRSISDPVALQQALEEAQAYQQQQQAAALQQAAGSPLGSGGLLSRSVALAAAQAAARQLPGSPKLGRGGMGGEVQPQRAISAPASELWAYAAELSAEAGTPQAVQQQQQWQRQQATSAATGQGHGASDFSFNWTAPTAAAQSPVLGVAPVPAAPLLPPQYWPQQ